MSHQLGRRAKNRPASLARRGVRYPGALVIARWGRGRLAIAATAAMALTAAAAAGAAVPKTFYGIVPQASLTDADFERMDEGRVGTLRFELYWAGVDRTAAADDYDWSGPDATVANAASHGVQLLPFVYGTPTWVAHGLDGFNCGDATCAPYAPREPRRARGLVGLRRRGRRPLWPRRRVLGGEPEIAQMPIRNWQIWNEQNSPTFYQPKPNVAGLREGARRPARTRSPRATRAQR